MQIVCEGRDGVGKGKKDVNKRKAKKVLLAHKPGHLTSVQEWHRNVQRQVVAELGTCLIFMVLSSVCSRM